MSPRSASLVEVPSPGPRGPIALKFADIRPAVGKLPVPPTAPLPRAHLFPSPVHLESQTAAILQRGEAILAPHPALVARPEHHVMRQHIGPLTYLPGERALHIRLYSLVIAGTWTKGNGG